MSDWGMLIVVSPIFVLIGIGAWAVKEWCDYMAEYRAYLDEYKLYLKEREEYDELWMRVYGGKR